MLNDSALVRDDKLRRAEAVVDFGLNQLIEQLEVIVVLVGIGDVDQFGIADANFKGTGGFI